MASFRYIFLSFCNFLSFFRFCQSDDMACANSQTITCLALRNQDSLPRYDNCDPINKRDCQMNDLIKEDIASCRLEMKSHKGTEGKSYGVRPLNIDARCYPEVRKYVNVYRHRVVGRSVGNPSCVPMSHTKPFLCGKEGTRCICDTGYPDAANPENFLQHKCRCQWFVNYCSVKDICTDAESAEACESYGRSVRCKGGSINQCVANPTLCGADEYCVELEDEDMVWELYEEVEGQGFTCIKKEIYDEIKLSAPYCNYRKQHVYLKRAPENGLEECCRQLLSCHDNGKDPGGFLFEKKPCHCNVVFRKCLINKMAKNNVLQKVGQGLLSVTAKIQVCTMDETGRCDPRKSGSCQKGDLINPSIAHCRVNCRTGPLLPIEIRSCRIRQCKPRHNVDEGARIIDVTFHRESSRCDAVNGLPVRCGFRHTRCVCDGKPSGGQFTDRCRCQYWPM